MNGVEVLEWLYQWAIGDKENIFGTDEMSWGELFEEYTPKEIVDIIVNHELKNIKER